MAKSPPSMVMEGMPAALAASRSPVRAVIRRAKPPYSPPPSLGAGSRWECISWVKRMVAVLPAPGISAALAPRASAPISSRQASRSAAPRFSSRLMCSLPNQKGRPPLRSIATIMTQIPSEWKRDLHELHKPGKPNPKTGGAAPGRAPGWFTPPAGFSCSR